MSFKLGIIGTGNMAEAIINGVISSGTLDLTEICAFEKKEDRAAFIREKYKIFFFANPGELIKNSEFILIAVKPGDAGELLEKASPFLDGKNNSIISICAGVSTGYIESKIKKEIPVIRIMPNTPALLRKGISAISTGRFSGSKDIEFAGKIMSGTGDCIIIDEKLQNAVTAVSGSGPAYFFLFCGEIIETAVKLGIDRKTAQKLVFATMRGSADMLEAYNGDTDFLIKMVRSPGGTTEAAMDVFLKNNFGKIVAEAVENAEQKAGRIQKGLENNN